jgi:hypothetical protein
MPAKWCPLTTALEFVNPEKVAAIMVTRRRNVNPRELMLNGIDIPYKREARHLGVTLDGKLSWAPHCSKKSRTSSVILVQCKRALRRKLGLKPRIRRWIYTAVVRPELVYAALVGLPVVYKTSMISKLVRVQRLALLNIFGVMHSTPTAAMEALSGLKPLHL